jgi:hypothetical protein
LEGWLSPVEGTRLEIERGVKLTVGSNPTPSAMLAPSSHFIFSTVVALIVLVLPGLALLRLCVPCGRLSLLSRLTIAPGITVAFITLLFAWYQLCRLPFGQVSAWLILLASLVLLAVEKIDGRWRVGAAWSVGKNELWPTLTLAGLLSLLLFVRGYAMRDCLVPPGIDSAQHTVIVQLLRDHHGLFQSWAPYDEAQSFTYHFGFHAVTVLFAWITGVDSAYAVFVMSRAVGLCAAASLFALVRLWTHSDWGGVFAVAMWELYSRHLHFFDLPGRWTLLTGLMVLPSALVLFDFFLTEHGRKWSVGLLTAITIAGLVLAQYKSALIFVVLATSLLFARCVAAIFTGTGVAAAVAGGRIVGTAGRDTGSYNLSGLRAKRLCGILAGSFCVALFALLLVAPRLSTVMQARTGQQLKRIVVEGPPMNAAAFGAPQLGAAEIFRTGFNTPQKIAASSLALLGGIIILVRRREVIWFAAGWLLLTLLMDPRLIGIDRVGLIDEIHWKFAVQTAIAVMAGLAVGLLCEMAMPRRALAWNIGLMSAALALAVYGATQLPPLPESSRFVLPDDLRLMSWIREHIPAGQKIAARSFFDHGHVQGYDAAVWLPYFARHQTNQTSLAADLEIAPGRDGARQFTRELYARDMSTPESARWMREQGFPWFFVGAIQPEVDANLLEQIERNPGLELAWKENAARLYRAR